MSSQRDTSTASSYDGEMWVLSNRGSGTYRRHGDALQFEWLPGGMTVLVEPPLRMLAKEGRRIVWVSSAASKDDVAVGNTGRIWPSGSEGAAVGRERPIEQRLLNIPKQQYDNYYGVISNICQWLGYHAIDPLHPVLAWMARPRRRRAAEQAWPDFYKVNKQFADEVIANAANSATVWVNDYHLLLAAWMIKAQRPDLQVAGYLHIAFSDSRDLLRMFGETPRNSRMVRLLVEAFGAVPWGSNSELWRTNLVRAHEKLLGRTPHAQPFVVPAYLDANHLALEALKPGVGHQMDRLQSEFGRLPDGLDDRPVMVMDARGDPKANLPAGVHAYRQLLTTPTKAVRQMSVEQRMQLVRRGILDVDGLRFSPNIRLIVISNPTREGFAPYDREWRRILNEIDNVSKVISASGRRGGVVFPCYPQVDATGKVTWKGERDAAVAALRLASLVVLPSIDGRGIIPLEAHCVKQPGDREVMSLISSLAASSEALRGTPQRPGAMVVDGIAPGRGSNRGGRRAVSRLTESLAQALILPADKTRARSSVETELVAAEDPRLFVEAIESEARRGVPSPAVTTHMRTGASTDFTAQPHSLSL